MTRARTFAALLAAALASGCALFGRREEAGPMEQLPVVADDRAFDPSQAVDDDDDLERPWGRASEQDQDAFAASDSGARSEPRGDAAKRSDDRHAAEASARAGDGAREPAARRADPLRDSATRPRDAVDQRSPGTAAAKTAPAKSAPKKPPDEHVATPQEVDTLVAQRRREIAHAESAPDGDAAAKARIAANPPPEPLGESKPTAWTVRDYALEGVLLAVLAAGVTLLVALARRAPRASLAIALTIVAFVVGVFVTQGE